MVLSVKNVVPDMLESILVRLDVKDLIRCKNVCKLWRSFISSNRFVNAHLRYRYDSDRNNSNFNLRRICMSSKLDSYPGLRKPKFRTSHNAYNVVGSSNGLVCIAASKRFRVLVVNPSTRQFKILPDPHIQHIQRFSPYMGFGYDSSSDDYKFVLGAINGFQVFSLKTNVWRYLGNKCQYAYLGALIHLGTLCNGAIHWLMREPRDGRCTSKVLIISFDLSTEEFEEIPQPDYDGDYKLDPFCTLGIINEGLCIFHPFFDYPIWVMKSYKLKESWTLMPAYYYIPPDQRVNDAIHTLEELKDDCIPHMGFFTSHDTLSYRFKNVDICSPMYVQSLVSPHVCRRLKRKREPNNNRKVIYSNLSIFLSFICLYQLCLTCESQAFGEPICFSFY